jgi:uroporphyrinogen III methyltransferase/synthase
MSGRVYLVGAGPGDPELLTLRGRRCLALADVVVHDDLVNRRLLEHARPDAEIVDVGRPHGGPGRLSQAAIGDLLIARARDGHVVVRLKNGDPFLFGRGGEEAQALRRAGIPFEVVPGVTSAIAVPAYAGIPVTDRDHASLVTIVTGHLASGEEAGGTPTLPWEPLARQGGTLVFVMAVKHLTAIAEALVRHGLRGDMPAAVIERGTTGSQRTIVATAATIGARAAAAGVSSPAVVVVGPTVGLREHIAWFESRPLLGRRIVVTRPRAQSSELAMQLEELGAEVELFPTIEIVPAPDPAALDGAVLAAATYDWIIFTSVNGVRVFFERLGALGCDVRDLATARIAAIGPETAAELTRRLVRPAIVPAEYRAEGLLAALGASEVRGRRVLLPRAAGARVVLPETLRAHGAHVDEVIAYAAVAPPGADVEGLRAALAAGAIDAITFTSSSTVRNFAALVGADAVAAMAQGARPLVACIGPVTAETARELGMRVDVMPRDYTVPSLVQGLVARFCNAQNDALSRGAQ